MITQTSDFIGEIQIANKTQPDIDELLTYFINKYEPIFMKDIMGNDFYDDYIEGLAVQPTPEARWTDLQAQFKGSVIAAFIYRWYAENDITQTTGTGEKQTAAANAVAASSWPKIVRAWNEMLPERDKIVKYLDENRAIYPEYTANWGANYWYPGCGWYWNWDWSDCCGHTNMYVRLNGLGL